jgi:hypothetical protein
MSFELTGKLIEKFETQQVNDKFRKREFVVESRNNVNGNEFVEQIKFQLIQDRCELIDLMEINDEIKVNFNLKGRRWERNGQVNYFTNLDAWRIEKASQAAQDEVPPPTDADELTFPDDEDVPF